CQLSTLEFVCFNTCLAIPYLARKKRLGYLFFSFPRGTTVVVGCVGRSEVPSLGGEVSFLGFFAILLLFWSPFAMWPP
ncbi:MAG: hypothetical protein ACKVIH_13895, partial [Burkholderiales bacterium]